MAELKLGTFYSLSYITFFSSSILLSRIINLLPNLRLTTALRVCQNGRRIKGHLTDTPFFILQRNRQMPRPQPQAPTRTTPTTEPEPSREYPADPEKLCPNQKTTITRTVAPSLP